MGLLSSLLGGGKKEEEPETAARDAAVDNANRHALAPGSEDDFDSHPDDPFQMKPKHEKTDKMVTMLRQIYGGK